MYKLVFKLEKAKCKRCDMLMCAAQFYDPACVDMSEHASPLPRYAVHPVICIMYHVLVYRIYSRAHKLFGHSRIFIFTIMIYVKQIIFSNDCISKRLKDRKLKLFS